jgi:U6 snRNA-associated Sm-like protein LSm1
VLQDAIERIFVGDIYGDIYAGIYVIRGENVVLLGEIVFPISTRLTVGS